MLGKVDGSLCTIETLLPSDDSNQLFQNGRLQGSVESIYMWWVVGENPNELVPIAIMKLPIGEDDACP